ncbi:schlafen family member 13-like isoform X2 [Montipora foliosa]|uniref:schlafen family member 13-like isoform X2 n=1 Tax=Montipora foliosa TaxID=591990 RepID=UPI0035F144FC
MPKRKPDEESPQKVKLLRATSSQEEERVRDIENRHSPTENSLENVLPTGVLDDDSDEMDVDESSPDSTQRPDTDGSLAEDILYRTIEIGKKSSVNLDVLQAICALLNSGGGVVHMKIANFDNSKSLLDQLDTFWQSLESKLDAMIKPSEYAEVFDRVVEKDVILLFVKAPGHCCTVEFNLFLAGDAKKTEASFKETVRLLQDRPLGTRKDFRRIPLQELPSLPESFSYEQKLDFHESKQIQFKWFPSKNPLLHGNNRTQRETIVNQISAFGNCSGGIILVGVRNDCTVLGQDMTSKENSREDIESRIRSLIEDMKWPCICERKVFWDIKFLPVAGKENCFVIAIYVAGIKGGVFTKKPKSYELRLEDDGKQQSISHLEFVEWKKRMLSGKDMLQHERTAVQELSNKLDSLSLSKGLLLTVKGSVGRILENFFKVEAGCPVSPKDFVKNLPKGAQEVVERIQEFSSTGRSRALLVGSPSWRACVSSKSDVQGESLSVDGVICDLLLFNRELGGLRLLTLCDTDRVDESLVSYSLTTAKALKKALVIQGGCKEKFYVTPHVVPCHAPERQIRQICQICPDSPYPGDYKLQEHRAKVNNILESLVIVLAAIPSALSSKQGVSFFNLLTKEQFQLLYQEIDRFKELWIKGPAGTGKTVVAVELIKELRRRDPDLKQDEILFVCENIGLREQIRKLQICKCLCRKSFMLMGEYHLREVKHVIMDEVQSFRDEDRKPGEESWLQKARRLVRQQSDDDDDDPDRGYLWLFIDNRQIHHGFPTGIPPENQQKPWFCLKKIIRNSKRIVDYASKKFLDKAALNEIEMGHDFEGEKVSVKNYQKGNEVSTLRKVVKSLRTEGYSDGDIAILYGKQDSMPENLEIKLKIGEVVKAEGNDSEHVVVSTFRKYSGLERPVVVLVNLIKQESLPLGSNLHRTIYCSATRAMVKLVILKEKQPTNQPSTV